MVKKERIAMKKPILNTAPDGAVWDKGFWWRYSTKRRYKYRLHGMCVNCGGPVWSTISLSTKIQQYCGKACKAAHLQIGKRSPNWKGGRHKNVQGYVILYVPDHPNSAKCGYIYEHRLAMSLHLGRPLNDSEIVHHKNGDRTDNRISNLQIMTNSNHLSFHHTGKFVSDETRAKLNWRYKSNLVARDNKTGRFIGA